MTPEAQRIAIAEACGWSYTMWGKTEVSITPPKGYGRRDNWFPEGSHQVPLRKGERWDQGHKPSEHNTALLYAAKVSYIEALPDYLNDLNACHEMEKALTEATEDAYWFKHLPDVVGANTGWLHQDIPKIAHATSAQRCKALLLTLNLWKD